LPLRQCSSLSVAMQRQGTVGSGPTGQAEPERGFKRLF
jgi:hypothetical protein